MLRRPLVAIFLLVAALGAQQDWNDPFPPHRIADNLYYVGSMGLSTYLVTSAEGHILINASFDRTVPLIRASVEKLGFAMSDVKIILGSHAHGDHMEGTALLQKLTGARVEVMEGDADVVANGNGGSWKPVHVDRLLHDGDQVSLGAVTLTARLTPGHTRGCTTWTMPAKDGDKTYNVVIVGSPNVNPGYQLVGNTGYPKIADDYARAFEIWKSLPADIFLGAHGDYYGLIKKHERLAKQPGVNPFVDAEGYRAYIAEREQAYRSELARQRGGK